MDAHTRPDTVDADIGTGLANKIQGRPRMQEEKMLMANSLNVVWSTKVVQRGQNQPKVAKRQLEAIKNTSGNSLKPK